MATKANNVIINLKAIGAEKTANDIRKVKSALDELGQSRKEMNDHDKEAIDNNKELTKQTRSLNSALNRQKKLMDGLVANQKTYARNLKDHTALTDKATTRSIKNQKRLMQINSMAMAEDRARRRETIANERAIEREKKRALRLEEKRIKEETRIYEQHVRRRKKLRQDLTPFPGFRRPVRVAVITSIISLVADGLSFIGTGLNSIAAGAMAGVNGLAPLVGMLTVIPAALGSLAQSIAPVVWGFKNIKAAWTGKDMENAGANTRALAKEFKRIKPEVDKLKKSVGDKVLAGFDKTIGNLANVYLPILNRRLSGTAKSINGVINYGLKWLAGSQGKGVMDAVMGDNNAFISGTGKGGINLIKTVLGLMQAAGPMLRLFSKEFQAWSGRLATTVFNNQKGLSGFFDKSYSTFKVVTKTLGTYGHGLYNLFKRSAPLTEHMSQGIQKAGDNFLKWTQSKGGMAAIDKYFKRMQPNLDAAVHLLGEFGKSIFKISDSDSFVDTANLIADKLLPSLVDIVKASDGKFIPNLVKFTDALARIAKGGLIDALSDIGETLVNIVDGFADWYEKQSDAVQHGLVWAVVLAGLFGKLATSIFRAGSKLAAFIGLLAKAKAAQWALAKVSRGRFGGNYPGGPNFGGRGSGLGGKGGPGGGSTVIAGGGGGKKGKGGARRAAPGKPAKGGAAPKRAAKSGGSGISKGAVVAGSAGILAMLGVGPLIDTLGGVSKAMTDNEFKAQGALQNLTKQGQTTSSSLNSMFSDLKGNDFGTFTEALNSMANPSKWQSFKQGTESVLGAILGATPQLDIAKSKFEGIDTALTNMPADQAATAFGRIRGEAQQMGIPLDKLVSVFPQYRDSLGGTVTAAEKAAGGMNNAGTAASVMSGRVNAAGQKLDAFGNIKADAKLTATDNATPKAIAAAGSVGNFNSKKGTATLGATDQATPKATTAGTKIQWVGGLHVNPMIDVNTNASSVAGMAQAAMNAVQNVSRTITITVQRVGAALGKNGGVIPGGGQAPRWTGGMVGAGRTALTGERGPEFAVSRSGGISLVGAGGREYFTPGSDTAIIPASATRDPFGGNYGYAPEWAKRMLQGAVAGNINNRGDAGGVFAPNVNVTVNNPSKDVDVKRAVVSAMKEIERDKEGRR